MIPIKVECHSGYKADEYPAIGISGGLATGNFSGARSQDTTSSVYLAPMLSWELDFWGKFKRSTEAARQRLAASEYGMRTIQIALITDVVSTYYLLLDYHQRHNCLPRLPPHHKRYPPRRRIQT